MTTNAWRDWYYQDKYLGKPYPFVDNYHLINHKNSNIKRKMDNKKNELSKLEK